VKLWRGRRKGEERGRRGRKRRRRDHPEGDCGR